MNTYQKFLLEQEEREKLNWEIQKLKNQPSPVILEFIENIFHSGVKFGFYLCLSLKKEENKV